MDQVTNSLSHNKIIHIQLTGSYNRLQASSCFILMDSDGAVIAIVMTGLSIESEVDFSTSQFFH